MNQESASAGPLEWVKPFVFSNRQANNQTYTPIDPVSLNPRHYNNIPPTSYPIPESNCRSVYRLIYIQKH